MNREWQKGVQIHKPTAAATLPPATTEETGWDILLALHSNDRRELAIDKLASIVSVPKTVLHGRLDGLEKQQLVTGTSDGLTGEVRARLTSAGRYLIDHYLSAIIAFQVGTLN